MTKISIYNIDENVTSVDKWIGSDGNSQNRTKNFTPKKIADYFNQNEVIDTSNSIRYRYDTIAVGDQRETGTLSFQTERGALVPISSLSPFILSKSTQGGKDVSNFLNVLPTTKILFHKSDNIDIFGIFKVSSIVVDIVEPDFFIVTLEFISGNGSIEEDNDYIISLIELAHTNITNTSELINDGSDGVHPFITLEDTAGFVPYVGAVTDVDLGVYDITASHLIKDGGQASQFLKADGSVDNNVYLTSADLPSTLDLYATTTASDVSGYSVLVRNISDSRFNTTAVDVSTGVITSLEQLVGSLISDANIISGNPGVFDLTTIGNISRTNGTGQAEFFFRVYKRTALGVETFITQSDNTLPVINGGYVEFSATALWNDGVFLDTDRIVIKYYANRLTNPTGSNPTYKFQFGGLNPVRSTAAIPTAVMPNIYLRDLADVEDVTPINNEILYWNDSASLWEHSLVEDLAPIASATQKGILSSSDWTLFNGKTSGSGTLNYIPKFIGVGSIGNSSMVDNGYYIQNNFTGNGSLGGQHYGVDTISAFYNNLGNYGYRWLANNGTNTLMTLFPNGYLSLGVSTQGVKFVNAGALNANSPTLGSGTIGANAILSESGLYGLYTGVSANGHVWQQVQANNGVFDTFNLSLQPSGGSVGIGTTTIVASAKLQVESTTQGFLPPRMTNAQRVAIVSPAVGLCVYCTDVTEGLYVYKSTGWDTHTPLSIIPIEIGASMSLSSIHNGLPLIITASCTVTIPNGLAPGFNASFITLAGVTLTIALGTSVVLFNNTGLTMAEKLTFTLQARTTTNNYITAGNL